MTKSELIEALADVPDDATVFINSWPENTDKQGPNIGDLYEVLSVRTFDDEGPNAPPFAEIAANVAFVRQKLH